MATEKPELIYDEVDFDSAIDDFGDETVQFCVKAFIDKTYNELKTLLPTLYKAQNYKDIRGKMHILKTNSGYMGANNFQSLCKEFETCCKFESLNEKRIDELYPIFMTNLEKLHKKLKKLYAEKFESEIKEEVELENKKDDDENIQNIQTNPDNNENKNKNEEIKENKIPEEKKETENNENKDNKDNKEQEELNKEKINNNEIINTKEEKNENVNKLNKIEKTEKKEEKNNEDNYNNIIIKKNPIKRDLSLQQSKISNIKMNINIMNIANQKITPTINENEKSNVSSENSNNINDMIKPKNFSSKNVLDLYSLKEGDDHKYHQNQFYKNIFQSFRLTEEESKNKKVQKKVQFSPKYISESQKNKILNRLKLGFSTMDKNDIRDSLTRYDLAVLKNSATLVKENLIKFLDEELPKIKEDFNNILESHDLSKKKEVIEKINIIINYMKYLTDNYNKFFFRMIEKIEICSDRKSFKSILDKLIDKLKLLEQELTVIYRVKIKRDNSLLKSMGYYQNDNVNKNSKKNLPVDMLNNYNSLRNRENNYEQIEGLKKNLGMYNNNSLKNKNSKKKLIHFPYSFKVQSLFFLEDKKNIHTSFNINVINNEKNEHKEEEDKNIIIIDDKNNENKDKDNIKNEEFDFNKDSQACLDLFKNALNKKNADELIQAINDFKTNLVKKYFFTGMEQTIDKWISKINKSDNFEDLNAYIGDIEDIIDYMKSELENKNSGIENEEEESQEDEDILNNEEQKKVQEDNIDKEDMALFSQLKKFNTEAFFLPRNPSFSQHKFKMKVEKIIREATQNSQEINQNNYNSNYNFVDKASSHIILSQNFRTKKNKLIGFSYPFKEDTFLNNCIII